MEYDKIILNTMNSKEDEFIREAYFIEFVRFFPCFQKIPNQELYNYTSNLIKKKKEEFDYLKKQLDRGITTFEP